MMIIGVILALFTFVQIANTFSLPCLQRVQLSSSSASSRKLFSNRIGRNNHFRQGRYHSPNKLAADTMGYVAKDETVLQQPKGFFNAVGLSSKFFVSGIATIVLYLTDSWIPLYYIFASVINGVISKVLKMIIRQPRPIKSGKEGYGMPSSHTQAFFFFFTVVALNSSRFLRYELSVALSLSILCYSCMASYWRVVANVHTFSQTVVGAVVGVAFGAFISQNEASLISILGPMTKGSTGVPLPAKICISTLGALVICKSEIKSLIKFILKPNRPSSKIKSK
jgi:membrane-associated phospholipid phosphatase